VARRCREAQLRAPDTNTIRVRIAAIPPRERLSRRSHRKAAVDQFAPRPGVFDSAQRPLDLVQIDHTKLDIIVVDDEQRLPIGRPWITAIFAHPLEKFRACLPPEALKTAGGDAGVVDGVLGVAVAEIILD
jgi:putative transposase